METVLKMIANAIRFDKSLHYIGGSILALLGLVLGAWFGFPVAPMLGLPVSGAVGKEIYDAFHPSHTSDPWDAFATVLGALPIWIAYALGRGINYL